MIKQTKTLLALPFEDLLSGLDNCFSKFSALYIAAAIISFLVSWWVYVPLHELGHALGCILGGGNVSKLEISPMYGAALLKEIFPFVSVGSEYAGQLTGFDTKGNDLIYLLTVFLPFLLTIFIGVPLLRSVPRSTPIAAEIKLGLGFPIAFAPFISFSGDYYEMGSIIISKIANLISPTIEMIRWRSDDVFKLVEELFFNGNFYGITDVAGVTVSFLLGIILIYITYMLGIAWSNLILGSSSHFTQSE
jgi:hypothetical protein